MKYEIWNVFTMFFSKDWVILFDTNVHHLSYTSYLALRNSACKCVHYINSFNDSNINHIAKDSIHN